MGVFSLLLAQFYYDMICVQCVNIVTHVDKCGAQRMTSRCLLQLVLHLSLKHQQHFPLILELNFQLS